MPNGRKTIQQDRERYRVTGPARVGEEAYEKRTAEQTGPLGTTVTVELTFCNSCRKVMHSADEVGGACAVCGLLLCLECARQRCVLCGGCSCVSHVTEIRDKSFCVTHGFFEIWGYLLFGR